MQIGQGYLVNVTCVQDFKLEQQCVLHPGSAHIVDTIKRGACITFNCYPYYKALGHKSLYVQTYK
jgi:hypothetical protein